MALTLGSVNLDNITAGIPHFALADNGYQQAIATPPGDGSIPPYVTDVITVLAHGANADALAVLMQSLDAERVAAARYWADPTEDTPVWLQAQLSGETSARRALVKSVAVQQISPTFSPPAPEAWEVRLAVERHPYWEDTTETTMANNLSQSATADDYDPGIDGAGDVPARMSDFNATALGGITLSRWWMGIRSGNKHGTLGNFVKIWECESGGVVLGTDAALAADATASPGGGGNTKVTITPGTATWAKRLTVELRDVTANYSDNLGRFLWLLRTQVSSGTWEIYLRFGYTGTPDADLVRGHIVELTSTSWDYLNMGTAMIPLRGAGRDQTPVTSYVPYWTIQVWARRTDGSGTLDLDCFCPIPVDEGYLLASGNTGVANPTLYYEAGPQDVETVIAYQGNRNDVEFESWNFRMPPGDTRVMIVAARASSSVLADTYSINQPKYYERWLSLKGAAAAA